MNLDRTFCLSPKFVNACGRQWTKNHEETAKRVGKIRISFAYYCGAPEEKENT